jgi:nitroreductase
MTDFHSLAAQRCSVRRFADRPIEAEKLTLVLEAARIAPTAKNAQPFRIYVLETPESLDKLAKACKTFGAPLALVICGDNNETWVRSWDAKDTLEIDASIVTDHMMLQAEDLGLSSCWICAFNPSVLRSELSIPGHLTPVNVLILGYAEGPKKSPQRHAQERRPLDELVIRL